MGASKTSISGASSDRHVGEFWDQHDLADYWDQTHEVEMMVAIESSTVYFPVEKSLAEKLRSVAEVRGVSPETLLKNLLQEHVANEAPAK